jgi:3-oxoacyl-[acyl-carrier-protein] synthase III
VKSVRYVGVGSFVPERIIDNHRITRAIPGWEGDRIAQRTGIVERRYLWDFDEERGKAIAPPADAYPRTNTDMAEVALRQALDCAGLEARDLDAVYLVTSTPDEINFCRDAVELHRRLGCRWDASALVVDSGCGGAVYLVDMAQKLIRAGQARTVAIVASTFASAFLDRDVFTTPSPDNPRMNAFLSFYLFGDGAGALILRGDEDKRLGVVESVAGTDHPELVIHRGGGARAPAYRSTNADHAWFVDGRHVARAYPEYMQRSVDALRERAPGMFSELERYYLHQANKFVMLGFAERAGIPLERVPVNVHRYGNTSAACTLLLFAEDVASGKVKLGSGTPVLFAAVGAGVHFGGQIVRV